MPALLAPSPSIEPAIQNLRALVDALQYAAIDRDLAAMAEAVNDLHESGWRLYEAVAGDQGAAQVACILQPDPASQTRQRLELFRATAERVLGQEKLRRATA